MRVTTSVINDIFLPVLLYVFFLLFRVRVCAMPLASGVVNAFRVWGARGAGGRGKQRIGFGEIRFERLANALLAATYIALSIEPGSEHAESGQEPPTAPDLNCVCKMQDAAASPVQVARMVFLG